MGLSGFNPVDELGNQGLTLRIAEDSVQDVGRR